MTNELVKFEETTNIARAFKESGMFPDIKSEAQAIVKIQAGKELGVEPFAAMQGIDIIQGKPRMSSNLQAALIKRSGKYDFKVLEHTDKICKLEFFKIIGDTMQSWGFSEFTIAEAQQAGVSGKDNYKKHPKNMLFARALSNGARWHCADIFITGTYNESDEFEYTAQVAVDNSGIEALKQSPTIVIDNAKATDTNKIIERYVNGNTVTEFVTSPNHGPATVSFGVASDKPDIVASAVLETEEVPLDDLAQMKDALEKATTQEELKAIADAIKAYGEMPDEKRKELLAVFNKKRKELK